MKGLTLLLSYKNREATTAEKKRYQSMTGSIMFSIIEMKPNIIFAILIAIRFAKNAGHQYTKVVKTILQYLKDSKKQGITFGG